MWCMKIRYFSYTKTISVHPKLNPPLPKQTHQSKKLQKTGNTQTILYFTNEIKSIPFFDAICIAYRFKNCWNKDWVLTPEGF